MEPPDVIQLPAAQKHTGTENPVVPMVDNASLPDETPCPESGDLFAWGLSGLSEQAEIHPMKLKGSFNSIAVGQSHACVWNSEKPGLFAWGINDMGQIGMEEKTVASPVSVPGFKDSIVKDVACGESHTAVLLNNGKLIMLGSNEFGQCGISDESMFSASFHEVHIKDEKFVRVSCGDNFTLAITKSGKIFSCGLNDHWELGFESDGSVRIPTLVTSLFGVPVVSIACGSAHCLALSATGQVFSWGRNKYGNLGLGHTREAKGPHIISSLSGVRIVKVSCGSSHSAVLSSTHRVFLFGQNSFGQCGQEDFENVLRPQEISHLKSELLIGVFCGSFHTVCLTKQRVIFAFGRNNSQQCSASAAHTERIVVPSKVVAPRLSDDKILFIACSSDSTFAIIQDHSKAISFDSEIDEEVDIKDSSYVSLPMNPLYHVDGRKISLLTKASASTLNYSRILKTVCSVFSSLEALNGSFLSSDQKNMNEFFSSGLQLQAIQPAFDAVYDLSVPEVTNALTRSISSCLEIALKNVNLIKFPAALRFIIILYENPKLRNPAYSKSILKSLNMTVASLSESMQMQLIRWMSRTEVRILRGWIDTIQTSLSDYFEDKPRIDEFVVSCVLMLKILNNANELRDEKIPFQAFTSNVISRSKVVDLKLDYRNWLSYLHTSEESSSRQFLFCRFPFLLDIVAKQEIIQFDAELRMQYEAQKLISQSLWFSPVNPFLIIQVRRSHLREDTLNAINQVLSMNQSILKRPLKVKFMGEEGIDEGGVKKEFFQLIVKELFLEDFGMFLHNEEQRHFWFNQDSFESEQEFQLIGVILGLAIYNSINLDVHFPLVVYKKLCGMTLTYKDLQFLDPRMYASLLEILSFVGDVENTFCLNFTVTRDYYGSLRTHELKEGGTHISVDNSNREEYVNCLSLYIMETSIKKQFDAFARGFHAAIGGPALALLRPSELETLICGNPTLDFDALRVKTEYRGGFHSESRVIKWFWEIVDEMSLEQQKKLLFFATGSDRAPLRGLGQLPFIIQNAGANTAQLPSAHTCFNTLLIPNYDSKVDLQSKLAIAIENAEGFGLQ